jgi:hypothetical protein
VEVAAAAAAEVGIITLVTTAVEVVVAHLLALSLTLML